MNNIKHIAGITFIVCILICLYYSTKRDVYSEVYSGISAICALIVAAGARLEEIIKSNK